MNFLELINKCLLELNYKQVSSFAELVKQDHKRIIAILNIINKEICAIENWQFLLRKTKLLIPSNTTEVENPVNGRILYILSNKGKYRFYSNIEPFLTDSAPNGTYSVCQNKLLFPKSSEDVECDVIYYTNNCVKTSEGKEQTDFVSPKDESIIPMPFAEQVLVYGTCMRVKANPQYIKFAYWANMYKEALLNLKSKTSAYSQDSPVVKLFRQK